MAITLSAAIGPNDPSVLLSGDVPSDVFRLDSELLLITLHPGITHSQRVVDGSGQGADVAVSLLVTRGFGGTQAVSHTAGTAATALYHAWTVTPGTTV